MPKSCTRYYFVVSRRIKRAASLEFCLLDGATRRQRSGHAERTAGFTAAPSPSASLKGLAPVGITEWCICSADSIPVLPWLLLGLVLRWEILCRPSLAPALESLRARLCPAVSASPREPWLGE